MNLRNGKTMKLLMASGLLTISLGAFVPVALSGEPLVFSYRTISVMEAPDQPGITVLTLEIEVTNTDTVAYSSVTVTAISLADPTSNYGSVVVGDFRAGVSQTVTGEFRVPTDSIETMTLRIDR